MRTLWTVVTLVVAAVVVLGGLVAWFDPGLLLPSGAAVTHPVRLYGYRMAARNLALGIALVALLATRRWPGLAAVLGVVALVEVGDTISAVSDADWASAAPAVVVAVLAAVAAARAPRPLTG